jgi:hypothetical protein
VHHIAFRAADDATEFAMMRKLAENHGLRTTEQKDRNYFRSLYFREPGGVLFEIATDIPGFAADEPIASLGQALKLPAPLEPRREGGSRRCCLPSRLAQHTRPRPAARATGLPQQSNGAEEASTRHHDHHHRTLAPPPFVPATAPAGRRSCSCTARAATRTISCRSGRPSRPVPRCCRRAAGCSKAACRASSAPREGRVRRRGRATPRPRTRRLRPGRPRRLQARHSHRARVLEWRQHRSRGAAASARGLAGAVLLRAMVPLKRPATRTSTASLCSSCPATWTPLCLRTTPPAWRQS